MCLCLWMIAHMFGADGSAMPSARASLVHLIVRLIVHRSCIARPSDRASDRPSDRPSDRASLVRLIVRLLVHLIVRSSISARASVVHRWSACSSAARLSARRCPVVGLPLICHACIARLSPRLSAGLPLSCHWYIAGLSAGVVVAALSAALPLVLPLLCLFVRRWSLTGPSLVCLLVSLCSVTDPSLPRLLGSWSLTCLLVSCRCSAAALLLRCLIVRLVVHRSSAALLLHSAAPLGCSTAPLGCSTAPLGCSTPLHSAARLHSTRLLYYSTPLALRAFLFYLLVEFGRHAVHTHSVSRVVSRHSVITHSLF